MFHKFIRSIGVNPMTGSGNGLNRRLREELTDPRSIGVGNIGRLAATQEKGWLFKGTRRRESFAEFGIIGVDAVQGNPPFICRPVIAQVLQQESAQGQIRNSRRQGFFKFGARMILLQVKGKKGLEDGHMLGRVSAQGNIHNNKPAHAEPVP